MIDKIKNMNWALIVTFLGTGFLWYASFKIGFFSVLMYVIIGACIGGIYFKLKEERW